MLEKESPADVAAWFARHSIDESISHADMSEALRLLHRFAIIESSAKRFIPDLKVPVTLFKQLSARKVATVRDVNSFLDFLALYRRPASEVFDAIRVVRSLDLPIDRHTIFSLVNALTKINQPTQASQVLKIAEHKGIAYDVASCSDLIIKSHLRRLLANRNQYRTSANRPRITRDLDWLAAKSIVESLAENVERRAHIDTAMLSNFTIAASKLHYPQGCLYWVDFAHRLKIRPLTPLYNSLLESYCRVGDRAAAHSCLDRMLASEDRSVLWPTTFTFGALLRMMVQQQRDELDFHRIFSRMKSLGIALDTDLYNILLWHQAHRGLVSKVEQTFDRMVNAEKLPPNTMSYNCRLVARATKYGIRPLGDKHFVQFAPLKSGRMSTEAYNDLVRVYEEMTTAPKQLSPNSKTINTMILCAWDANDKERAFSLVEQTEQMIARSPSQLVEQVSGQHDLVAATSSATSGNDHDYQSSSNVGTNRRILLDTDTYNSLLMMFLSNSDSPGALSILSTRMPSTGVSPDRRTFCALLDYALQLEDWSGMGAVLAELKRTSPGLQRFLIVSDRAQEQQPQKQRQRSDDDEEELDAGKNILKRWFGRAMKQRRLPHALADDVGSLSRDMSLQSSKDQK